MKTQTTQEHIWPLVNEWWVEAEVFRDLLNKQRQCYVLVLGAFVLLESCTLESLWFLSTNPLKWHTNKVTHRRKGCETVWEQFHVLVPGPPFPSLGLDSFPFSQGMKKNSRQGSSFLCKTQDTPITTIHCNILYFFFKRSVGLGNVQAHEPKTEFWPPFGPHRIFLENKSWNGEWKKDNLRARPTAEKQSTGTFDSEIPAQVCKLGKIGFLFFLIRCQSCIKQQKLISLFIFKFLWNYKKRTE